MKLIIDTVRFSEPDLRKFHQEGFDAVQAAVEAARQALATARTTDEKLRALHLAELARERRQAELRLGETLFDKARNKTFFFLGNTRAQLAKSSTSGSRRAALDEVINAAVARYACKDFESCRKLCDEVRTALATIPKGTEKPKVTMISPPIPARLKAPVTAPAAYPLSPSVLYENGRQAEQNRQYEDAAKAYRLVLQMKPSHGLAQSGLQRLQKLTSPAVPRRQETGRKFGRLG